MAKNMVNSESANNYFGDPEEEPPAPCEAEEFEDDEEDEDETNYGPDYPIGMNLEPYDLQGDR
jgi:hypothetical protein